MNIAIIGGGPSGLFMLKKILDASIDHLDITIYEKGDVLGAGMPYSRKGASDEHVTNVSANETPALVLPIDQWIKDVHPDTLARFHINLDNFHSYKVLPRLLFGQYLSDQFNAMVARAKQASVALKVRYNAEVVDILDRPKEHEVKVILANGERVVHEKVMICTGHSWPSANEETAKGYFDSPYPPEKLKIKANHSVAIRGASLTAIDAVRTLARENGEFRSADGELTYHLHEDSPNFKMVLHSLHGLLPAVRFHLEEPLVGKDTLFDTHEMAEIREKHQGFVPLDLIFEEKFKLPLATIDPVFYEKIKNLSVTEFVDRMMSFREEKDPFELFKLEYRQAEQSIKKRESIYWKEMLGSLSYILNYPAKYFSAEDMIKLKTVLMPLISLVIAYVPQGSAKELLALHAAGLLSIVAVDRASEVEKLPSGGIAYHYQANGVKNGPVFPLFVDAVGQPPLSFEAFPYSSLKENATVSAAKLKFKDAQNAIQLLSEGNTNIQIDHNGHYFLKVPGVAINDNFQITDAYYAFNPRIYIMAVPLIGGYNPDYSGLEFCEQAATVIAASLKNANVLR